MDLVLCVFGGCLIGAALGLGVSALAGAAKKGGDKCCGGNDHD